MASSARTNLGPLTTAFAYPASCTVNVQDCGTCTLGWQGQTCGTNTQNTQGVEDNGECWPPVANSSVTFGLAFNGLGFYSPGVSCPIGYQTACVATGGVAGGFNFQYPLLSGETAAGCCPSGYTCRNQRGLDHGQTCYSIASTGSFPTVQCTSGSSNEFSYVSMPFTAMVTASGSVSAKILDAISLDAPMFQLNMQATDLLAGQPAGPTATDTSAMAAGASGSLSVSPVSTAAGGRLPTSAAASGGLSAGAAAGIGLTVALVVLALIGGFIAFVMRRRRRLAEMPTLPPSMPPSSTLALSTLQPDNAQKPEYPGNGGEPRQQNVVHEAPPHWLQAEMPQKAEYPDYGGKSKQQDVVHEAPPQWVQEERSELSAV